MTTTTKSGEALATVKAGDVVVLDGVARTVRSAYSTGAGTYTFLLAKIDGERRPPLVMVGGYSSLKSIEVVA